MATSTRGRKSTGKGTGKKKQPQRGMGVAKLENLRIQERWRRMTEPLAGPLPLSELTGSAYGMPLMPKPTDQAPMVQTHFGASASLTHRRLAGGGNGGKGNMDPYCRTAAPEGGYCHFQMGNEARGCGVLEASGELSSMPKIQRHFLDCNFCLNKGLGVRNGGKNGAYAEAALRTDGYDFLGLRLGDQNYIAVDGKLHKQYCFDHEGLEAEGFERKLQRSISGAKGGGNVTEYEFFPLERGSDRPVNSNSSSNSNSNSNNNSSPCCCSYNKEPSKKLMREFWGSSAGDKSDFDSVDLSLRL